MVYRKLYINVVFFLIFIGVNITFFPLHFVGLCGYPRKYVDYPDVYRFWNTFSSFGSLLTLFGVFFFIFLIMKSLFSFNLSTFTGNFYGLENIVEKFSHSFLERPSFFYLNKHYKKLY